MLVTVLIFGEKYILYFLWLSWALFFDSNAAVFKLKDTTKKREAYLSDKQISLICCYGYGEGEQSFQASLFCYVSVYLFNVTLSLYL